MAHAVYKSRKGFRCSECGRFATIGEDKIIGSKSKEVLFGIEVSRPVFAAKLECKVHGELGYNLYTVPDTNVDYLGFGIEGLD